MTVCANIILEDDRVSLVRESKPTALGRWSVPAGKLESGEILQAGAEREALEETGLVVEAGSLLDIYHCLEALEGGAAMTFVFESTVNGGHIATSADHPEVRFVPPDEVAALQASNLIRGQYVGLALAAAAAGTQLPAGAVTIVDASSPPVTLR